MTMTARQRREFEERNKNQRKQPNRQATFKVTKSGLSEAITVAADSLEDTAEKLLQFVGTLDPLWQERIQITRQERGYTALQAISAWIGHTLDAGTHMLYPPHPFFDTGFKAAGAHKACDYCGKNFVVAFAGQRCCNDVCIDRMRRGLPLPEPEPVPFVELPPGEVDAAELTD